MGTASAHVRKGMVELCVLNVTRKYFAVTGANEIVCSVEPLFGMTVTRR